MSSPSDSQSNHSPSPRMTPSSAPRTNAVPLITPRYQKKQRANRRIEVTDSSEERKTIAAALLEHTREVLTVHNGSSVYAQEMHFHPYELYRHGRHQIHSRSVGYSSDGDLIVTREAISEPSDVDLMVVRRRSEIDNAICLDPKARRPQTDGEMGKKLRFGSGTLSKYPGIRAPKNRKVRNRLLNDYFASEHARVILEKYRERHAGGFNNNDYNNNDNDLTPPGGAVFAELPPVFDGNFFELDEDAQTRALEGHGVKINPTPKSAALPLRDPDSGESRFQCLNYRLRGEMLHALNSEYLSRQIEDLECAFAAFIVKGSAGQPLIYHFRDGYGRLVCHGVAAYYKLVSESQLQPDGTKITIVTFPKKKRGDNLLTLPHVSLMQMLRRDRGDMPGKHSCSTNTTPQSTPYNYISQPDETPPPFVLEETNNGTPLAEPGTTGFTMESTPEDQEKDENDENENKACPGGDSPCVGFYQPPAVDNGSLTATQRKKMRKAIRGSVQQQRKKEEEEQQQQPQQQRRTKNNNNNKCALKGQHVHTESHDNHEILRAEERNAVSSEA